MNKKDLEHYKKLILEKRKELLTELDHLKKSGLNSTLKDSTGEHSAYSFHMADMGTDTMEREKAFLFASREGNLLYHLDRALERIDAGEYGVCAECNKPIDRERLEAVPHVRLCIQCKSKEEKTKA